MAATAYSIDELTLDFAEADYKPQSRELTTGLFYEWEINAATIKQQDETKGGHLAMSIECKALDSDGKQMAKKWLYVALPVSIGENSSPVWAKGMWLGSIRPLYPEWAPYDSVEKDPITDKRVYMKDGKPLKGKEYDVAITEANKKVGALAKEFAKEWIENGDGHKIEAFAGKKFFAKLKVDKSGKYTNFDWMQANAPTDEEVCYDRKVALPQ